MSTLGSGDSQGPSRADDACAVDVVDPAGLIDPSAREWVRLKAAECLRHLGGRGEVRVRIISDAAMAFAHAKFSGVEGTTDVLTFDLTEGASATTREFDLDILVCADEARRQSAERGHRVEQELLLYVVHGVMHALGHDDHDEVSAAAMHRAEDELLERAGVGRVFDRGGGDA